MAVTYFCAAMSVFQIFGFVPFGTDRNGYKNEI